MRVNGRACPAAATTRGASPGRVSDGAFTLPPAASGSSGVFATAAIGALDAILAVQDQSAARERRRRAVRRGHALLDRLEELRTCLIEGRIEPALLSRLRQDLAVPPEAEEPGLKLVVAEIELRAEVEIAKLEAARATA
ncbi:MAG: flagellar assembly protein FliX [Geminicoccaceae bacterium]